MGEKELTFEFPEITTKIVTPLHIGSAENVQPIIPVMAFWDTGASYSMITPRVAEALNLKPSGNIALMHVSGDKLETPKYRARIYFTPKLFINLPVAESDLFGFEADILIGMDIISMGDFAISNFNGKTMLSFRIPPVAAIDFYSERHGPP